MCKYVYYICAFRAHHVKDTVEEWLQNCCPGYVSYSKDHITYTRIELQDHHQAFMFSIAWADIIIPRPDVEDWITPRRI
jgi:hypothetical protein